MFKFRKMFNNIIVLTILAGFNLPESQEMSETAKKWFKIYSPLTVITLFTNWLLVTYLLLFKWETVRDPTFSGLAFFLFVYTIFISVYVHVVRDKFDGLLRRIDAVTQKFHQNPLCNKTTFSISSKKLVKKSNKYSVRYVLFMSTLSLTNTLTCLINYWFSLSDKILLAYQFPFDPTEFPIYDISMLYQLITGLISATKKCAADSLFAALFLYLNLCYKQLGDMIKDVFDKNDIPYDEGKRLKLWIQIHQQYQR